MLIGSVRSGVVEARHPVSVVAVDGDGTVVFRAGEDQGTRFFFRSAAKPFQATVSRRLGMPLAPEQLALVSASHGGQPIHVALAERLLAEAGLGPDHLLCPPAWPASAGAVRRLAAAGVEAPHRLFNNCSGKHSGMLRACVAQGWPLNYTDAQHPLQQAIRDEVAASTGESPDPMGVDGCGVPTFSGTVAGLAAAFARLATDPALAPVAEAMARFAPLTADGDRAEAELARWCHAAVKGGAQGCVGVAWFGGLGVAAKCWSGQDAPALVGIIAALRLLGILPDYPAAMLAEVAQPAVLGGGRPVGHLQVLEGPG